MLRVKYKTRKGLLAGAVAFSLAFAAIAGAAADEGEFIYDSKGRRSPFSPPLVEGQPDQDTVPDDQEVIDRIRGMLTGVLWDEDRPIAFMVGSEKEVVEIGDVIEGWRIVDITRRGIVIQKGEKVIDLPIHEDEENEG